MCDNKKISIGIITKVLFLTASDDLFWNIETRSVVSFHPYCSMDEKKRRTLFRCFKKGHRSPLRIILFVHTNDVFSRMNDYYQIVQKIDVNMCPVHSDTSLVRICTKRFFTLDETYLLVCFFLQFESLASERRKTNCEKLATELLEY